MRQRRILRVSNRVCGSRARQDREREILGSNACRSDVLNRPLYDVDPQQLSTLLAGGKERGVGVRMGGEFIGGCSHWSPKTVDRADEDHRAESRCLQNAHVNSSIRGGWEGGR